ncbi:MAG TPA: CoA pyrophosphatase [Rhodothermales bacterium]|nr:CoA pyrophosphatase [Rhodothermales bacterium]
MQFDSTLIHLENHLRSPLPGVTAQSQMAPPYRQTLVEEALRIAREESGKPPRHAAVALILFPKDETTHIILTVRRSDLKDHPGQVSFPGGRIEPQESPEEAAYREAQEEVGIDPAQLRVIGRLSELYIPPSNFLVQPFVMYHTTVPQFVRQATEVEKVLEVPLAHFMKPENRKTQPWHRNGEVIQMPTFVAAGHTIWGGTAMMLNELLALFRDTT